MRKEKLQRRVYDIFVNSICLLQLAGIIIFLIAAWHTIPDRIPGHYNAAGVIDRWGDKGELLILPIVSLFLYLLITGLERFPHLWNTGVNVSETNKVQVYRTLKNMIGTTKLMMVTTFTGITLNASFAQALPAWFLPVFLFLVFAPIIFFVAKLVRIK